MGQNLIIRRKKHVCKHAVYKGPGPYLHCVWCWKRVGQRLSEAKLRKLRTAAKKRLKKRKEPHSDELAKDVTAFAKKINKRSLARLWLARKKRLYDVYRKKFCKTCQQKTNWSCPYPLTCMQCGLRDKQ